MDKKLFTTGIGSLPHHNLDSALEYSMQYDIPFLPQLPKSHKNEFMVAQALEYLPGMYLEEEFECRVNLKTWYQQKDDFEKKFVMATKENDYSGFQPTPEFHSAWKGFTFELEERKVSTAKVQIAGPLTAYTTVKLSDGSDLSGLPELQNHCLRAIMALGLSMIQELKHRGIKPLIFIDEPALYFHLVNDPLKKAQIQDLRWLIMSYQKAGADIGVHCCSNTYWPALLELPIDYLSLDVQLSMKNFLSHKTAVQDYFARGGKLSLGILPTSQTSQIRSPIVSPDIEKIFGAWEDFEYINNQKARELMGEWLITPACGLATRSARDAEEYLAQLHEIQKKFMPFLAISH